jgi:hypothetical protein
MFIGRLEDLDIGFPKYLLFYPNLKDPVGQSFF